MKNIKERMQSVVEGRLQRVQEKRDALLSDWKPYLDAVGNYMQERQNKTMTVMDKHNVAQCLENALMETGLGHSSSIMETTYADNISFLGVQLPIIAALLPSLVLNEIALVQALDRRQGAVFFLDAQYGTTKGTITAGDTMISAKTGHATSAAARKYAMTLVTGETLADDTLAGNIVTGSLAYNSVQLGTIVIYHGDEVIRDDECCPGKLVSEETGNPCGWVMEDGTFSVTLNATPSSAGSVTTDYSYYYDQATNGVPEVNINLNCESVTAIDFPLKAQYSVGASIDLEKAHGLSLEDELVKYLGGEIKFEIDHYGIDMIETAATGAGGAAGAAGIGTWTAAPSNGQEWLWKKYEILDKVEQASNAIFAATLRGMCNFIICGNNAARVIRQLGDHFTPAPGLDKIVPTGPIVLGKLDGRTVIQDPFMTTNRMIYGYRGDNYLYAGFMYAPYIPLFTTPTIVLANLTAQKGFLSSAGFKTINAGLFTFGTVDVSGL